MARRLWTLVAVVGLALGGLIAPAAVGAAGSNVLTAQLSGTHGVPPVPTAGTGSARVIIQGDGSTIFYEIFYSNLSGPVVAAHIHFGAAGANGPIILPFTVGPSPMSGTLTAANFTGAGGLTYAQALDAIRNGGTYVNLHTAAHPGGEVRGQLYDASVPQTYSIVADAPQAVPAGHVWEFDDYFPRTLSVAAGSIVRFDLRGFHTATLLPTSVSVQQDQTAHGIIALDSDDTALNVNGTTRAVQQIPSVVDDLPTAGCGTDANPCSFDGTRVVSHGPLVAGPPPAGPPTPTSIRIDAPTGTYAVHCRIHPSMVGWITVVTPGQLGAAPDDVAATVSAQTAADVADGNASMGAAEAWAARVNHASSRTKHAWAGYESPDHWVGIDEMIPASLNVHAGDKVVWHLRGRNNPHTVTFPTELHSEVQLLCEGGGGADTPAVRTVNPPTGPGDFGCPAGSQFELELGGGNGVNVITSRSTASDSGFLATAAAAGPFAVPPSIVPHSWSVRFSATATPGTYHYVCQIHDGMEGDVIVGS